MKLLRRTTAILLCLLTLVSMFTTTAFAADTEIAKFTLTKGEELWYRDSWGYTGHELTVQIEGYPARKAYCVDASLPAPNTSSNYRITSSTIDLADGKSMSYQRYKNLCKALYYCYGGAGYTSAQSNAFGVSTSSKTIVMDGVNVETYGHKFVYQNHPYTMDCMMGNICYSIWGYNMLGAEGKDLVYLLSHRVIAYLSGSPDWYYNLPEDGPDGSNYSYWELAILECANAIYNAPDVPLSTNLYLCYFGSGYQRLLVPFDSVRLQLNKTSANPELTDGNSCYSLAGAVYNVYTDEACTNCIGSMTTNDTGYAYYGDGNGNKGSNVPLQSYYAKEVKAPQGYELDTTVYQFTNSGRKSDNVPIYEVKCSDIPANDPVYVLLQKKNAVTGEMVAIEGAEFTMSYYGGFYTAEELEGVAPTRQWVLKTDSRGFISLSNDYLVSGDELFYDKYGIVTMPLGTFSIQETKAPEGYLINPEVFVGQLKDSTSGISWFTTNELDPDGNLIVLEQPANGYAGVYKIDEDGSEVQGAVYGLYSSAETDANGMCLTSNKLAEKTTGTDGLAVFDIGLEVGKEFYIQEISAPIGYELDKRVYTVKPTEDNTDIAHPALVTVTENITTGDLKIVKTSEDGIVADVWFSIVDSNGKRYTDVSTGSDGTVTVNHLPVYNRDKSLISYTVTELGKKNVDGTYSLPSKYVPTTAQTQTLVENSVVTYNYYNELFKGNLKIVKTSDDNLNSDIWFSITASNGQKIDNVKTGTDGTVTVEDLVMYDSANNKIEYTVKELGVLNSDGTYSIPLRYLENSETVTVEMDSSTVATVNFHNTIKTGDLAIHKNSSDDIIEGLWFSVKSSNGQSIPDVVTGSDGTVTVTDLPIYDENNNLIKYTVKELGLKDSNGNYYLPDRYIATSPRTLTLSEYTITNFYFVNSVGTGDLKIAKTSEDGIVSDLWFKVVADNGMEYEVVTGADGTARLASIPVYNSADTLINYTIVELGTKNADGTYTFPARYKPSSPQTTTIKTHASVTVSFNNVLQRGSLKIVKTSDDNIVSNVWFSITSSDGQTLPNVVTGADGIVTVDNLLVYDSNNNKISYTVTELGLKNADGSYTLPAKYKPTEAQTLTLTENTTISYNFHNELVKGDLKIKKYSEDKCNSNVWFSVVSSDGKVDKKVVTGANGTVLLTGLNVYDDYGNKISYTVTELGVLNADGSYSIPVRYIEPEAQTYTLSEYSENIYIFTNELHKGELIISKSAEDGIVSDIYFEIKSSDGRINEIVKTNEYGIAKPSKDIYVYDSNNNKISYTVTELGVLNADGSYSIPKRYKQNVKPIITSLKNEIIYDFHNTINKGDLKINKSSEDDVVSGVWFSVVSSDGKTNSEVETGSDGYVYIYDLPIYDENDNHIEYTITELGFKNSDGTYELPIKYVITQPQTITLSEDNTMLSINFVNKTKKGNIELYKTSEDGEIANIYFNLSDTKGYDYGNFKTDENGYINFGTYELYDNTDNLIKYVVTELGIRNADRTYTVPYKYKSPSTKKFTLTQDGTYTVSFANKLKVGTVTLTKYGTNNFKLAGASYKLYYADGTEVMLSSTGTSSFVYSAKGSALTLTTTTTGSFKITGLPQGDYYLIETKAPNGYSLVKDKIAFSISGEDETTLNRTVDVTNTAKIPVPFTGGDNFGNTMVQVGLLLFGFGAMVTVIVLYKKRNHIRKEN